MFPFGLADNDVSKSNVFQWIIRMGWFWSTSSDPNHQSKSNFAKCTNHVGYCFSGSVCTIDARSRKSDDNVVPSHPAKNIAIIVFLARSKSFMFFV